MPDTVIKMRRHQLNGIWRGITDSAVLYDHVVGAGKTFTAIARAMERRRMGLSRKAMIVVPNHLVEQWAHDATLLYPAANVLAAGKADFERSNRRRLFARIATGDYDMVIVGHSSFGFVDLDQATEERYLKEELESAYKAVKEAEEEAAENGQGSGWRKPFGVKEAERLVNKLEDRLARLRDTSRDRLLTFEEMGIDDLTSMKRTSSRTSPTLPGLPASPAWATRPARRRRWTFILKSARCANGPAHRLPSSQARRSAIPWPRCISCCAIWCPKR